MASEDSDTFSNAPTLTGDPPVDTQRSQSLMVIVRHPADAASAGTGSHKHYIPRHPVLSKGELRASDTQYASDILASILADPARNGSAFDRGRCTLKEQGDTKPSSSVEQSWNVGLGMCDTVLKHGSPTEKAATLRSGMTLRTEDGSTDMLEWHPHLFYTEHKGDNGRSVSLTEAESGTVKRWRGASPLKLARTTPTEEMTRTLYEAMDNNLRDWMNNNTGFTLARCDY
ncbi:uncharacterized protein MKK02DRAFT_40281 [Dioszegia hungarica]|uniref:Uncharacterized protein n=1 Tax=Dioszegia hungarica TaxID=4972 RepID=A0AA38LQD0_9TREE|nr:uncharacterized protein MKK02DRAFT_40281 [Dioszegia hungarica]KAI9633117.1 hypothetical protein MKK02DRAFT_40281 [Dioszegia hungarica]